MSDVTKLYAAYKAGYLGDNILDTYFSFVANILVEEHISVVEDHVIASKLSERYSIDFPLPFIRQVLGVGVQNNCFVEDHGKYSVVIEELSKYRFQESNFNSLWSQLINEFEKYCRSIDVDISSFNTEEFILRILNASDEVIISGEKVESDKGLSPTEYAWYSFVRNQAEDNTDLYSFITAVSASNITKQALFYAGEASVDYSDLCVFGFSYRFCFVRHGRTSSNRII